MSRLAGAMPSNRLALLSVAVGSALLGWSTAGVSAIGSDLSSATQSVPAVTQQQPLDVDHHHDHGGHHGHPGV
jgi:sugar/nucleoside kinase (ribokinase family)